MKQKLSIVAIILTVSILASCNGTKKGMQQDIKNNATVETTTKDDCSVVHWSHHKGEDGPENWKSLCDGFSDCSGVTQSPINIETKNVVVNDGELTAPKFSYSKSSVHIINNGHTVQFNVLGDNSVNLKGKNYKLLQFHYHALSEHTIDGNHYPIEVHFVHQHSASDFAVLGIMFKEGEENVLFKRYLDEFPAEKGEYSSDEMIDLSSLFPNDKSYFNYNGSLTTPPCSEVVDWYVLKTPVTASKEQIEQFSETLHNNYRPIQPLNDRHVKLFSE